MEKKVVQVSVSSDRTDGESEQFAEIKKILFPLSPEDKGKHLHSAIVLLRDAILKGEEHPEITDVEICPISGTHGYLGVCKGKIFRFHFCRMRDFASITIKGDQYTVDHVLFLLRTKLIAVIQESALQPV